MRNRRIFVCLLYALLLDRLVEGHEESLYKKPTVSAETVHVNVEASVTDPASGAKLSDEKLVDPQSIAAHAAPPGERVIDADSVTLQAAAAASKSSVGQKTGDLGRPPASPPIFPSFSPFEALNLQAAAVEQAAQAAATSQKTESPREAAAAQVPPEVQHHVHNDVQQPREMKVIVTPQIIETPRTAAAAAAQEPPEVPQADIDAAFIRAHIESDRHIYDTIRNNDVQQRLREIEARYERERVEREAQRGSIWTQALGRLFGFGGSSNTRGSNARGVHESADKAQAALRGQAGANAAQRGDIPIPHRAAAMGARMGEAAGYDEALKTRRAAGVQGDASSFFFVPVLVAAVFAYFVYSFIKVTRGKRGSKRGSRKSRKRGVFGVGKSRRSSSSSSDSDDLGSSAASGMFNPAVLAAISAVAQQRASQTNTGTPNTTSATTTSPPPAETQTQAQAQAQPAAPVKSVASPSGGENAKAFVGKDVGSMSLDELVALQRALLDETLKRQQTQTTPQPSVASSPEQPTAPSSDEFGLRKRILQAESDAPAESSSK